MTSDSSDVNQWRKRFEHPISPQELGKLDGAFPWKYKNHKEVSDFPTGDPHPLRSLEFLCDQTSLRCQTPVGHGVSNEFLPSGFPKW